MVTPALFPVVDPYQQTFPISEFQLNFGFDQVITSAYLMSKRAAETKGIDVKDLQWNELPDVHKYLEFDGIVMMDSGAYQVMVYGDIELGTTETLDLQKSVKPDIGVLMDHPIGYQNTFKQAKERVKTTIQNLKLSIPHFSDTTVNWTLPIQGGKYINLLNEYLDQVIQPGIIDHFGFYALGSVVPVMINQDYETLVKMITTTRVKLPITKPLHLFGAGHPSMFALAVFLGCDTFDSAAYALMAKDQRYMTVDGTYTLDSLDDFPCSCKVCTTYTPSEFKRLEPNIITDELTRHNLWISNEEIRRIRNAIKHGRLWELVLQRSASVPRLARATRKAIDFVSSGDISKLYREGTAVSSTTALRIARQLDVFRSELSMVKDESEYFITNNHFTEVVVIASSMHESIYNRIPDNEIVKCKIPPKVKLFLHLPPFGIIPLAFNERYPIAQLVHDLEILDFGTNDFEYHLQLLSNSGVTKLHYVIPPEWPLQFADILRSTSLDIGIHEGEKPLQILKQIFLNIPKSD